MNRGQDYESDVQLALSLVDTMHRLRIVPKLIDRVFVLNIAMELVLGSANKEFCFEKVMDLKRKMDDLGLKPNFNTYVNIIRAAEWAPPGKGLTVMLENLTEVRKMKNADAPLYMSCFRVLVKSAEQGTDRKVIDNTAATLFGCCCDDGVLTSFVKNSFGKLCSPETVDRLYTKRLEKDSKEPKSWTWRAGSYY